MEFIRKQFQLQTTTSGTTEGIIYIPDTSVRYTLKLLLKSEQYDWGFFDTYEDENATNLSGETLSTETFVITGSSKSRLVELKKYTTNVDLSIAYFTSTTPTNNGLNIGLSTVNELTYYLSGITYVDNVSANITTFSFVSSGLSSPNFDNKSIVKDEAKQNIIDKPEVNNDVFIIRQSLSVFQNIYRIEEINNISEFENYAGGAKFNIINNT